MDALRQEAADRAAAANAANDANTGTTTSDGSVVRPSQPPTRPPQPPADTTSGLPDEPQDSRLSDLFSKMMEGINAQRVGMADAIDDTGIDGTGAGAGMGTGTGPGRGLIDQGGASAGSAAQLQQALASDINEISAILSRGANAPDVQSIFATQGRTVLDMIDQQIREMQAEGETIDPATANTLATMREELDRQLKANLEFMNARGIAESGITIEAQSILRKGNMSDQAKILAERLSRIQSNIQSLRGQKTSSASQFGLAGANAQTQAELAERNRLDDLRGLRQQGRTTLLNNQTGIEQAQMSRDFTGRQAQASRDFEAEQNGIQRQFAMAQKMADLSANAHDAAAERQWEERKLMLQQEFQASQQAQRASGTSRTAAPRTTAAPAGDITEQAIDDMYNTFATRREAEDALRDPAILLDLQENGVDIGKLIDAAQGLGERRAGTSDY